MSESSIVSLLQWGVGLLIVWVAFITLTLFQTRLKLAEKYHDKPEIDAIIDRVMKAVTREIRAEISPLSLRVGLVLNALKIQVPPEHRPDDA